MIITINNKEYELNFGIRFVKELDSKHNIPMNGKDIGIGLEECIPLLLADDIMTLEEIIYTATWRYNSRPTAEELDDYIDNAPDIDGLFEKILDELKKQNATRRKCLALIADFEARQKETIRMMKEAEKRERVTSKSTKRG